MHIAVIYSGVGGANGADYVAEMLADGFRDLGYNATMVGKHGGYDLPDAVAGMARADLAVHASGFNLTESAAAAIRAKAPLALWSFTDEILWWGEIIQRAAGWVDHHFAYTQQYAYSPPRPPVYLPLASCPRRFSPQRYEYADGLRDIDVLLIGARRRYRVALCEAIGRRFPRHEWSWAMARPFAELNALYQRAKVVIAPVQDCDEDQPGRAWGCPCRTFEARGAGAVSLDVVRGGLADVYPDALTMPDCTGVVDVDAKAWGDRIEGLLASPGLRARVAMTDYLHTMAHNLYRHRAQTMMDVCLPGVGGMQGGEGVPRIGSFTSTYRPTPINRTALGDNL